MSYYGVSVLITILVTSLVAFCLLYKAKELSLGIVISISIGSIILGFTFCPVFKTVMKLLSEYINLNQKLALIISLLIVLIIFLLFILIVSFIISICIPKKLASIDCCITVDRLISKIKGGTIKDIMAKLSRKIVAKMQETVKNVFNLLNKLKKPVDTKQIIDTMGIEKNENVIPNEKSNNAPNNVDFASLVGFMEPLRDATNETQDISTDTETIEANDDEYDNLVAAAFEEIVTTQVYDIETDVVSTEIIEQGQEVEVPEDETVEINVVDSELQENEIEEADAVESEIQENETVQIDAVESEIQENEIEEADAVVSQIPEDEIQEIEVVKNEAPQIETPEIHLLPDDVISAESFVFKAFECKDNDREEAAIEYYIEALQHGPNDEMIFWIVLDVCALYKKLGLSELAKSILEGLASEYGAAIQPEVKMEIMNYL